MVADKKSSSGIEGKQVEIYLQTPLFRFRYVFNNEERELIENAVHISGTIQSECAGGFLVRIKVLSNMKTKVKQLPFETLFLPTDKIDFMIVT